MQHISEIIEDILVEWAYRVHDGMPNPKNAQHIHELRKSMEELNLPNNVIYQVIDNLINEVTDTETKFKARSKETNKIIYFKNQDNLIQMQETFHTGTDQTPVNMLVHQRGIEMKLLPYEFNMNDMNRKEVLGEDLLFTDIGWIYQYNAIPNNKDNQLTNYFMEKTYKHLYGELND